MNFLELRLNGVGDHSAAFFGVQAPGARTIGSEDQQTADHRHIFKEQQLLHERLVGGSHPERVEEHRGHQGEDRHQQGHHTRLKASEQGHRAQHLNGNGRCCGQGGQRQAHGGDVAHRAFKAEHLGHASGQKEGDHQKPADEVECVDHENLLR